MVGLDLVRPSLVPPSRRFALILNIFDAVQGQNYRQLEVVELNLGVFNALFLRLSPRF